MLYFPDEATFGFKHFNADFKPDLAIRISRTPLLTTDPNTYISISPFVEDNMRKLHTSAGNQTMEKLKLPAESDKPDTMPIGCGANPLFADPFSDVHLTPGCIAKIVPFLDIPEQQFQPISGRSLGRLWGRKPSSEPIAVSSDPVSKDGKYDNLKCPRSSLNRSSSNFISKVVTTDNLAKKLNSASRLLIAGHGRIINVINLESDPSRIEAESPYMRISLALGVVTCMATFSYLTSGGERNLDVAVGFSTGDVIWFNPFKMKYTRFNKNGRVVKRAVSSLEWSRCGRYLIGGYHSGDVTVFDRSFEDCETYPETCSVIRRQSHAKWFRKCSEKYVDNPISHVKLSNKAVTSVSVHPTCQNVVCCTCDDGWMRILDMKGEFVADLVPSYYGGLLCSTFTEDGKYLITGGEDDYVSVYELSLSADSPARLKLSARLQGHTSWVRQVGVDSVRSTPGLVYCIGSIGDDGSIIFHEFEPRNLPKIKQPVKNAPMERNLSSIAGSPNPGGLSSFRSRLQFRKSSVSSQTSGPGNHLSISEMIKSNSVNSRLNPEEMPEDDSETPFEYSRGASFGTEETAVHGVVGAREVAVVSPVCIKSLNLGRLSGFYFGQNHIWCFCAGGDLLRYVRPI